MIILHRKGHIDVATQLLGHKIDACIKKISNGATALHLACRHGHIDIARRILQSGAYMEAKMIAMVEDPDKGDNESQVVVIAFSYSLELSMRICFKIFSIKVAGVSLLP